MGNCLVADHPNNSTTVNNISRLFRSHNANQNTTHLSMSTNDINRARHLNGSAQNGSRFLTNQGDTSIHSRSSMHLNSSSLLHDLVNNNNQQMDNNQFISDNNNIKSSLNNLVNGKNNNNNLKSQQHQIMSNGINGMSSNNSPVKQIMICLTDFDAREESELSIRKGDRLVVTDEGHPDWCLAEHTTTKRTGYVPKIYLSSEPLEMKEWFFAKTNRREAEKLLLSPYHCRGTFLIRNSEQADTGFSLSIRDEDQMKKVHIKHYKIKTLKNDGGYFVALRNTFRTLEELINFYCKASNGLCCRLEQPCPKPKAIYWPDRGKEIRRSELRMEQKIGTGCFGEVYYGYYMQYQVAIKTLKQGTMSPEAFLAEATIMKKCRHKNLVPLLGICSKEEPLLIVTEYMKNGSLLEYLRNNPEGKSLKLADLIVMAYEIASGMEYLEKVKLIHRDLAARNILVDEDRSVKVADFGLARVIEDSEYTARQGARFPIKWTAPEAAMYGRFSIKSDVWSYGILLYELITHGSIPYAGMHNKEVVERVQLGYRIPRPTNCDCPEEVYARMLDCWNSDAEKRPSFEWLASYFETYSISSEQSYRDASDFK